MIAWSNQLTTVISLIPNNKYLLIFNNASESIDVVSIGDRYIEQASFALHFFSIWLSFLPVSFHNLFHILFLSIFHSSVTFVLRTSQNACLNKF